MEQTASLVSFNDDSYLKCMLKQWELSKPNQATTETKGVNV